MLMEEEDVDSYHRKNKNNDMYIRLFQKRPETFKGLKMTMFEGMEKDKEDNKENPEDQQDNEDKRLARNGEIRTSEVEGNSVNKLYERFKRRKRNKKKDKREKQAEIQKAKIAEQNPENEINIRGAVDEVQEHQIRTIIGRKVRLKIDKTRCENNSEFPLIEIFGNIPDNVHILESHLKEYQFVRLKNIRIDVTYKSRKEFKPIYNTREIKERVINKNGRNNIICFCCQMFVHKKRICWIKIKRLTRNKKFDCSDYVNLSEILCSNSSGVTLPIIRYVIKFEKKETSIEKKIKYRTAIQKEEDPEITRMREERKRERNMKKGQDHRRSMEINNLEIAREEQGRRRGNPGCTCGRPNCPSIV